MKKALAAADELPQARLWQRRLFEAVTGLTKWLVEERSGEYFNDWLRMQRDIFTGLPEGNSSEKWQGAFFRAQALMERFIVGHYGEAELAPWTKASAYVFGHTAPDYGPGAAGIVARLARQADCYGSSYSREEDTADHASITISHCSIWDYRERARAAGVKLTLSSPCTYCTQLTAANISAKGYQPAWSLAEQVDGHGCHWEVER